MTYFGRKKCDTLKAIRKKIADISGIKYEPHKCTYEGECSGTCPACEAEVRYLESELKKKYGSTKNVAAISLCASLSFTGVATTSCKQQSTAGEPTTTDSLLKQTITLNDLLVGKTPATIADSIESQTDKDIEESCTTPTKSSRKIKLGGASDRADRIIHDDVDKYPSFPGGEEKFMSWIHEHIKPTDTTESGASAYITFVVEPNGSCTNIQITKSTSDSFSKDIIKAFSSMPRWKPGILNGKAVRTRMAFPIQIDFQ